MKFNLDDYEPVDARIKKFYAEHEDGRITTDLLSDPNSIGTAVVKAFVYVGDVLKSTGLAFEKAGDGMANKTSHLENCETSAIGRALANYNYSGNKRASREEMQKVERSEPSPDEAKTKTRDYLSQHESELHPDFVSMAIEDIERAGSVEDVRKVYLRIQHKVKEQEMVENV